MERSQLTLQETTIAELDTLQARLIFLNDELVAVASQLGPLHGTTEGHWFIEAAFGFEVKTGDTFPSLEALTDFLTGSLG